jgi:hypothetical protein
MTRFSNLVILNLPAYEYGTECSETSAYKIQTPGNYPEESIQYSILMIRTYVTFDVVPVTSCIYVVTKRLHVAFIQRELMCIFTFTVRVRL